MSRATAFLATPAAVPAPPAGSPSIAVIVTDERPDQEGGSDRRRVGTVRALYGSGAGMREESPDSVRRLVESATTAGLAKAGIVSASGGGTTLQVRIWKFWMDGYAFYTAELHGDLVLKKNGSEAWRKTVKVNATGEQSGSASAMFNTVWGWTVGATEFNVDDRQKLTFEIKARDALKKAGLPEKRGAFPEVAVRYVSLYEEEAKTRKVTGYRVTTRLSLKHASGEVLWEDSFEIKGSLGSLDPKNGNYVDATFSASIDHSWKTEVVKRLKAPEFRRAAGR